MTTIILPYDFLKKLCTAVGEDPKLVRRIVIDAGIDSAILIYVEKYGDDKLLQIDFPTPDGIKIKKVGVIDPGVLE